MRGATGRRPAPAWLRPSAALGVDHVKTLEIVRKLARVPLHGRQVAALPLELRAQRPAAAFSGADPDTDARRALLELRLRF